jgi:hypothetical protein
VGAQAPHLSIFIYLSVSLAGQGAEFHTYLKWAEEKKTLATSDIFPYM